MAPFFVFLPSSSFQSLSWKSFLVSFSLSFHSLIFLSTFLSLGLTRSWTSKSILRRLCWVTHSSPGIYSTVLCFDDASSCQDEIYSHRNISAFVCDVVLHLLLNQVFRIFRLSCWQNCNTLSPSSILPPIPYTPIFSSLPFLSLPMWPFRSPATSMSLP